MLYSGTVWRLINQNPRTLFPYPLKPSIVPIKSAPTMSFSIRRILQHLHTHTLNPSVQIPVHWHTVQSISFQSVHFYPYPFSEYPSQTVPIYLILQYWYAHIPVSLIRYQLVGMRNIPVSLIRYRLVGMQYIPVSIIRYRLIGMRNVSATLITYRLSDMLYISATFIMYHLTGM